MLDALEAQTPPPRPAKQLPASAPEPAPAAVPVPVPVPIHVPAPTPESLALARSRSLPPIPPDHPSPSSDTALLPITPDNPSPSSDTVHPHFHENDDGSGHEGASSDSNMSCTSNAHPALDFCVPHAPSGVVPAPGPAPGGLSLSRSSLPTPSEPFSGSDHGERTQRPLPAPAPAPMPISLPPPVQVDASAALGAGPARAPSRPIRTTLGQWEPDEATDECHLCHRAFGLFTRRHHCRACGRVCCAQCTRRRAILPQHLIVHPPDVDDAPLPPVPPTATHSRSVSVPPPLPREPDQIESDPVRVCDECAAELGNRDRRPQPEAEVFDPFPPPSRARRIERSSSTAGQSEGNVLTQYFSYLSLGGESPHLSRSLPTQAHRPPRPRMLECPVCTRLVAQEGEEEMLEAHVRACIESPTTALLAASGARSSAQPRPVADHSRYARDTLQEGNPLIGRECLICMEDFEVGEVVARMACLCAFHEACLRSWLSRGPGCPTHRPPSPSHE